MKSGKKGNLAADFLFLWVDIFSIGDEIFIEIPYIIIGKINL